MPTITAHTLFIGAAKYSAAGATSSLGCPKPAAVSLLFASKPMKKTRFSVCYCYADPKSPEHPSNIPTGALLAREPTPTATKYWKVKKDKKEAELTLLNLPEDPEPADLQVFVEGDVLHISREPKGPDGKTRLNVRLQLPEFYTKQAIKAVLKSRNDLVVTMPKNYKMRVPVGEESKENKQENIEESKENKEKNKDTNVANP